MPYLGGFKNHFRKEYVVVNLRDLAAFKAGDEVTTAALAEKGMIRQGQASEMLKVLGEGKLDRALKVTAHKVSDSAREADRGGGRQRHADRDADLSEDEAQQDAARDRDAPSAPAAGAGISERGDRQANCPGAPRRSVSE